MSNTTTFPVPLFPAMSGRREASAVEKASNVSRPAPPSDRALLELVASGDQDAFSTLYRRYERMIFGTLLRYAGDRALAEELLQEAFTRVWLGAKSHDPSRGEVKPWLFAIALNTARSELARKRHRTHHVSIDEHAFDLEGEGEAEISQRLTDRRQATLLAQAIRELPDFMREVVVLRCSRELTFAEISQVTGAPEGTLKSRFHRAVAELRQSINQGAGRS